MKERKLVYNYDGFVDGIAHSYEYELPTDNDKITHWYPCVSLRDANDECEIMDVTIQ